MRMPNADRAFVAEEKLRDDLLNPRHRRGASKAKRLIAMGYSADQSPTRGAVVNDGVSLSALLCVEASAARVSA